MNRGTVLRRGGLAAAAGGAREAASPRPGSRDDRVTGVIVPIALLTLAGAGWWWAARMTGDAMTGPAQEMSDMGHGAGGMGHALGLSAFLIAWLAMMAAMMLPAVLPVVKLYARAAAAGRAAALPFFLTGYLGLWAAVGLPAYFAWRALIDPIAEGQPWAGRLAGATLLTAALWQLSPLKAVCLRHCRSPLGFFLRFGGQIRRPRRALLMGAAHGGFCLGCCWALFAVLVAVGTMNLLWMAGLTALVVLEKNAPGGHRIAAAGACGLALGGAALLLSPSLLVHVT